MSPKKAANNLVLNPNIVLLQRRLFSPTYEGPGKWVLFDSSTRRSHLAIRKQQDYKAKALPTVLRLLLDLSGHRTNIEPRHAEQLEDAGLLVKPGDTEQNCLSFLSIFQRSVFNYPFFDYSTTETFQLDQQLMAEYYASSPVPPPWTPREGIRLNLPLTNWESPISRPIQGFALSELASVLHYAFGPIERLEHVGPGAHFRRTSPSGGAKHPTEAWVHVHTFWQGIDPGIYAYDCANHALVRSANTEVVANLDNLPPLYISVRSRVERPMWRYRDARSFRAVLIDAGHIIETVMTLLGLYGIPVAIWPGRGGDTHDPTWLREPEVAVLIPQLNQESAAPPPLNNVLIKSEPTGQLEGDAPPNCLATNPAMYFTFAGDHLLGHVLYPRIERCLIDETDFAILTHCILSHRGPATRPSDRLTTPANIMVEIEGSSDKRLRRLLNSGALIPAETARPLYGESRRWAEKGWYLPLLAWLEAVNSPSIEARRREPQACIRILHTRREITDVLRARVTTRAFSQDPIDHHELNTLIAKSYEIGSETRNVDCYVAALNVRGLKRENLYRWDRDQRTLVGLNNHITAAEVVDLTIGQQWVSDTAAAVWFVTYIDVERPQYFFLSNILLGRMAQSICILATDKHLGIFQTPAIEDRKFCTKVGLVIDYRMTAYLVCIGQAASLRHE